MAEQLAKIKDRVKQIQEREERDRRRTRRATRRAAIEGLAPEPEPETEVVSALSARLKWTKSVEARLRQESQALSAKIAREQAERAATVATLTQNVFGAQADMRMTGNLAGAESEFGLKLRRGGLAVDGRSRIFRRGWPDPSGRAAEGPDHYPWAESLPAGS